MNEETKLINLIKYKLHDDTQATVSILALFQSTQYWEIRNMNVT